MKDGTDCIPYGKYGLDTPTKHCADCHHSCLTCTGPGDEACVSCKSDLLTPENTRFYYQNQCLLACPDGTTYDQDDNKCYLCSSDLKQCGIGEPTVVVVCKDGLYLKTTENRDGSLEKNCIVNCPFGYFGDRLDNVCKLCDVKCTKCFGSATTC